eukprot:g881.t1
MKRGRNGHALVCPEESSTLTMGSKWNARFDNVCQTNGNVTRLSALAGAALSKKDAKTVMRYTNAVLHIYYLLNGSPDLTDETWEMLKNRGLLTSEEITKLKKQGSPGVVLYSWAIEAIQNAFAADPKGNLLGSHLLSSMEECIGGVRGLGAKQIAYSRTQIPFVYFHSVYLLVVVFLSLLLTATHLAECYGDEQYKYDLGNDLDSLWAESQDMSEEEEEFTEEDRQAYALWLLDKRENGATIDDPQQLPPITKLKDVYGVHQEMSAIQSTLGPHCGWKNGACGKAGQEAFGLSEPFFAPLFDNTLKQSGHTIDLSAGLTLIEAEFGFFFRAGLPPRGSDYTPDDVWGAVFAVTASIEVVGSRLVGRGFSEATAFQKLSDCGLNIDSVVGTSTDVQACRRDLENVQVQLLVNGVEASAGSGANVLGNPMNSLAWLANRLNADGLSSGSSQYNYDGIPGIRAGDFIMSGATCVLPTDNLKPGDEVVARFEGMGEVAIQCADGPPKAAL